MKIVEESDTPRQVKASAFSENAYSSHQKAYAEGVGRLDRYRKLPSEAVVVTNM